MQLLEEWNAGFVNSGKSKGVFTYSVSMSLGWQVERWTGTRCFDIPKQMSCFWKRPVGISSFLILQGENTFSLHFCFSFIKNLSLLSNRFGSVLWKMAKNRLTLLKRTSLEKLMLLLPLSFSLYLLLMTHIFTDLPFKITEGFTVPWDKFRISYRLLVVMWIYSRYKFIEGINYFFLCLSFLSFSDWSGETGAVTQRHRVAGLADKAGDPHKSVLRQQAAYWSSERVSYS